MKIKNFLLILLGMALGLASAAQAAEDIVSIIAPADAKVVRLDVAPGDKVFSGDELAVLKSTEGMSIILKAGVSGTIESIEMTPYRKITKGSTLGTIKTAVIVADHL